MCAFAILISVLSAAYFVWLALQLGQARTDLRTDLTILKQNSIHIIMKLSELATALSSVEATLTKIQAEVTALIEITQDVDLPADAQATLDRLQALVSTVDQLIPDEIVNGTGIAQI